MVASGCGGGGGGQGVTPSGPTPSPTTPPTSSSTTSSTKGDPFAVPNEPRDAAATASKIDPGPVKLDAWTKASAAKGVPAPPATCGAFAKRAAATPAPADVTAALAEKDVAKRDALLVALEKNETAPGTIRAIRAELGPVACGDSIVDPILGSKAGAKGEAGQRLVGLSLAAKLSRTAANAPTMADSGNAKPTDPTAEKERVKKFIQGPLRTWMVEQATAIEALSAPAAELLGRARGLVALEAGMADLRLVDKIRSAPTPKSWDAELKAVYEAALDEALEPRKARGRDATLVGLSDFAADGVMFDERVAHARELLSKLYGGRRIDALDALLVPGGEPQKDDVPEGVQLLVSGKVKAPAKPALARLHRGRLYWRRVDFVEAAHAAKAAGGEPEDRLVLATALALAKGPNGAKEMMAAPSPASLGLTHTEALDTIVAEGGKTAGMAAFNAALLRSLAPPEGAAAAAHFADVASRFEKAEALLEDGASKKQAKDRAADARAAAKTAAGPSTTEKK
jgi:hypothetical protein